MVNLPRFCEDENRHREKQEIVGDDVVHEVNEGPVDIHVKIDSRYRPAQPCVRIDTRTDSAHDA